MLLWGLSLGFLRLLDFFFLEGEDRPSEEADEPESEEVSSSETSA